MVDSLLSTRVTRSNVDLSHRVRGGIAKAIEISLQSNAPNFRVGAVLVRNGRAISAGFNCFKKSAPSSKTRYNGIHAEFSCVRKCMKRGEFRPGFDTGQLAGMTMFVARTTRTGRVAMAKPCTHCQELLRLLQLRRIYYTTQEGGIEELILS